MNLDKIELYYKHYESALLNNTLNFWTPRCEDKEFGGFFSYFDQKGNLVTKDKNGWVQGRMTWLYAKLYNEVEQKAEWLTLAKSGYNFLKDKVLDKDGRGWFSLSQEGHHLRQRRYLFVECFATIAFAEYYKATGDKEALDLARQELDLIYKLSKEGTIPKSNPEFCQERGHSLTMILISVLQIMRNADPQRDYNTLIDKQINEIFDYFIKPEKKVLLETVGPNGEFIDSPEGRTVNPGHAIETVWFIMEEARYRRDDDLFNRILPVLDWHLELGWDKTHGGIISFVDCKGLQPGQIEWDMKYWWPHNEALYATILAYKMSGEEKYFAWFETIHNWVEAHFPDKENGEWFGYLHYDGTVSNTLKANHWKSCFHLPRQQLMTAQLLKEMM